MRCGRPKVELDLPQRRLRYLQRFDKRRGYGYEVNEIRFEIDVLTAMGASRADMARYAYNKRNAIKLKYRRVTPQPLRGVFNVRNRLKYGDAIGRSFDRQFEHLRAKGATEGAAYDRLIMSASRTSDKWFVK